MNLPLTEVRLARGYVGEEESVSLSVLYKYTLAIMNNASLIGKIINNGNNVSIEAIK